MPVHSVLSTGGERQMTNPGYYCHLAESLRLRLPPEVIIQSPRPRSPLIFASFFHTPKTEILCFPGYVPSLFSAPINMDNDLHRSGSALASKELALLPITATC